MFAYITQEIYSEKSKQIIFFLCGSGAPAHFMQIPWLPNLESSAAIDITYSHYSLRVHVRCLLVVIFLI
jgi:hypothetical protein